MKRVKIACIGDSLTEGDYGIFGKSGIANVHSENYPYFLSILTKSEVKNFGYCGYKSSDVLNKFNNGEIDVSGCSIILIMLGTNGGQTETGKSVDDLAYLEIINQCKKQSSAAKIYLICPPYASSNPKWSNAGYLGRILDTEKFLHTIKPLINLPIINVYRDGPFKESTEEIYQNSDGLHLNKEGYKALADFIYLYIKKDIK